MRSPTREVLSIYESLFLAWTDEGLGGDQKRRELIRALLGGDVETCERLLEHWLLASAIASSSPSPKPGPLPPPSPDA